MLLTLPDWAPHRFTGFNIPAFIHVSHAIDTETLNSDSADYSVTVSKSPLVSGVGQSGQESGQKRTSWTAGPFEELLKMSPSRSKTDSKAFHARGSNGQPETRSPCHPVASIPLRKQDLDNQPHGISDHRTLRKGIT